MQVRLGIQTSKSKFTIDFESTGYLGKDKTSGLAMPVMPSYEHFETAGGNGLLLSHEEKYRVSETLTTSKKFRYPNLKERYE
jgi:hypothetical protein